MTNQHTTLELAELLLKREDLPQHCRVAVERVTYALLLPMSAVFAKVPGETVTDKCRIAGFPRWYYYRYMYKGKRPRRHHAERLSELTGYSVEQIMGFQGIRRRGAGRAKKPPGEALRAASAAPASP